MLSAVFFGTAIVLLLAVTFLLMMRWIFRQSQIQMEKVMELTQMQLRHIRTMTHMVASKDWETYRNLEMTTKPDPIPYEEMPAMDDASVAERLAERYAEHGLNPSFAYATDDTDPVHDFGGPEAFR